MGHGIERDAGSAPPLDEQLAKRVADTMQALAAPSRVRILDRLRAGPAPVGELAAAIGMEQSAVSHQLRVLRDLRLVVPSRSGRNIVYALHDSHVAVLLAEATHHVQHVLLDYPEPVAARPASARSRARDRSA